MYRPNNGTRRLRIRKSVEEMQKEEEMLTTAFNNSYNYLTNKVTMDYVLDASESEFGFVLWLIIHILGLRKWN